MPEKAKDIQTTKLEKSDKHMNKPIQAIKKLEDHFHKLSKKNKSVTTDTILPVNRTIDNTSKTTDASRTTDTSRSVIFVESTRNNESSQESIINRNVEQVESHNIKENDKNVKLIGKKTDIINDKSLMNGQKSPPNGTVQSSSSFLMNSDKIEAIKVKVLAEAKVENLTDSAIEQQLALLNQRLKILIDENEMIKKHEEQLFTTKNQILAKIDVVKKQISEAMDHYRIIAHACREKIEKEEILQNEMLMDLKERVDKLNDMCTDINNQADDMIITLNTYNVGKSDALYMITACSVDFIVRFFQQIYTTIISITKHCTKVLLPTTNSVSSNAISKREEN
uniref:Uncharacterized protein n=2 Tax=Wuchereria bancrofti TaxID=6293 RepID=A0AAF5Q712_WUCBA